ncbi:LexA family transcriptional regulator [Marinifilum flexuosum]|uniref:Phage repressor protein C with HTH and peptisase S24 domain n=1 Tax=Marinifilum flexuosum TaxID=1117708 RepID=A0A419X3P2_9BACT|nr:S24 family peptidase [Marinifilum flexuosum]RKE02345.1 phage repressor protein C with HTH and peptisase S24 domain [Marinifilum flexuosum]
MSQSANKQEKESQIATIEIIERLKSAYQLDTDSVLAEFLGVKRNTISSWKSRNTINYDLIFAKCDDLNLNWLITGEGQPFKKNSYKEPSESVDLVQDAKGAYHGISGKAVAVTDISVAAGNGGFANQDYITKEDTIQLPDQMLGQGYHICVRVKGDSMSPTLQDSGYVVIRLLEIEEWQHMRDEHIYVVSDKEGKAYLKRVKNRIERGFITLMSDNPDKSSYPNFNLQIEEIHTIWHAEWYFSAKMPNIHDQYYSRLQRLEDRFDDLAAQLKKGK